MKWKVTPSKLSGTIAIPPSKSHTIRAVLIAALADGTSVIRKPLLHGDGTSAAAAARALGAQVTETAGDLAITGVGKNREGGSDLFDMGNSGTGTSLFMSAAALGSRRRRFDGDASLRSRPFRPLLIALGKLGAEFFCELPKGDLPFTIQGPIQGGKTTVNGVSSQFVSSLLFACPLCDKDSDVSVENLQERPYVELSLWWLKKQGIKVSYAADYSRFHITGRQDYRPFESTIPADFSGAAFAACAAAVAGGAVTLAGLDFSDPQGDKGVFDVLRLMGAEVAHGPDGVTVQGGAALRGREIDLNAMPDALPALSVVACAAEGETRFVNVAQARIKETDRIAVMKEELSKMGAEVYEHDDGLTVRKSGLRGASVSGRNDHRVVMALAVAGMIAEGETIVDTAEAAAVTYPTFAEDFRKIGAFIETVEE
ncbi:MAG: 3-phosphoshikimate 1-carboxyvinyltransferase [Chitinispirillaceae bacterium]|nr:3-phosphoshikimate 1-carboxyvinyltransferase [Chitinispirillaceae bacterium]